jgi:hypothetical protein
MADARVEDALQGGNGRVARSSDVLAADSAPTLASAPDIRTSPATPMETAPLGRDINDPEFIEQLTQFRALRSFLTKQAIPVTGLSTGDLNLLRLGKQGEGRAPTASEWRLLEHSTEALFSLLSEPLRRKFLSSQVPAWLSLTAIILGGIAILAFVAGLYLAGPAETRQYVFVPFLVWASALGATGSIAFIGMNALAVQDDATFDLTNEKLIVLRIALGALFGVVLPLTVGYSYFLEYLKEASGETATTSGDVLARAAIILLPFILGFSTTLVIMILNRFVEAVQSLFGKNPAAPAPVVVPVREKAPDPDKEQRGS